MDIVSIIVLAVVQGVTEFLPISSSAHLILIPLILQWADQGLAFDVALHLGSLIAVTAYFRNQIRVMIKAWLQSLSGRNSDDSRMAWWVIIGTIPAVVIGYLFKDWIESQLRSPWVIVAATLFFGLLLLIADYRRGQSRTENQLQFVDVLIIGIFQSLAFIPGTSRSGITITAGLLLGLTRQAAARFSFLLSMPIILASGMLQSFDLMVSDVAIDWSALMLAVVFSAISAGLCIHVFLKLIERIGMLPFVIYRLILGALLMVLLLR